MPTSDVVTADVDAVVADADVVAADVDVVAADAGVVAADAGVVETGWVDMVEEWVPERVLCRKGKGIEKVL